MLRGVATSNPYEVRCERCGTSFAPETKRCVHCGGPLGAGLAVWLPRTPSGAAAPADEEEGELTHLRGRSVFWVVAAVLAMLGSLLRNCAGG
jgi:hypothetical protein